MLAVKPCTKLLPPTGPISPLQKSPAVGMGPSASAKAAAIAADLAETTVEVIRDAERLGRFQSIDEADQFEIEELITKEWVMP